MIIHGDATELAVAAAQRGIKVPLERTVARYGLTLEEWLALLEAQGWMCPICRRGGNRVKYTTDHQHVPNWKRMEPEQRKRYVRGILCIHCNWKVVHSRLTAAEARRIAEYLTHYEERRDHA